MTEQPVRDRVLAAFRWVDGHADIWRVFNDATVFGSVVRELASVAARQGATKIAGIESRGFILGAAVAAQAGVGFVAIRKEAGLLPGPKEAVRAAPDYRAQSHLLRVQRHALSADDRVLLVDDWAERGSQAVASRQLIERCGATWAGLALVVDQLDAVRREELTPVSCIVKASDLGPAE